MTNSVSCANARVTPIDARYATNRSRIEHSTELNAMFSKWMSEHDLNDILGAFEREGGTIAPVYSIDQIVSDPQMVARDAIVSVPDADFGSVRMQNVVPRFTNNPGQVTSTAGALGEHNHEVYIRQLGLTEVELQRLRDQNVV